MKILNGAKFLPAHATYAEMASPVGTLIMISSTQGLHALLWESAAHHPDYALMLAKLKLSPKDAVNVATKMQLDEYFLGNRQTFDLPLAVAGTPFQLSVWDQLTKIPYAQTISYGEQAKRVGDVKKARAVGAANGLNPISIIIPCHRVIGSNNKLTGFAGGLDKKEYLLNHERCITG